MSIKRDAALVIEAITKSRFNFIDLTFGVLFFLAIDRFGWGVAPMAFFVWLLVNMSLFMLQSYLDEDSK